MDKYYTPDVSEFHIGFEYEYKYNDSRGWTKFIFRTGIFMDEEESKDYCRVKCLNKEDVESVLNEFKNSNGTRWKIGKQGVDGYNPHIPWISFVLEDASEIIFNEYLKTVLIEKNFGNDRGLKVVFNGIVKNKSEFKKIIEQVKLYNK